MQITILFNDGIVGVNGLVIIGGSLREVIVQIEVVVSIKILAIKRLSAAQHHNKQRPNTNS